jgi:hypothetical protein
LGGKLELAKVMSGNKVKKMAVMSFMIVLEVLEKG